MALITPEIVGAPAALPPIPRCGQAARRPGSRDDSAIDTKLATRCLDIRNCRL